MGTADRAMPILGKFGEGLSFRVILIAADSALPFTQEVKLISRHKGTSLLLSHKNHLSKDIYFLDFKGLRNSRQSSFPSKASLLIS
jgi:hypothetical protein